MHLGTILSRIAKRFSKPKPRFQKGDSVQPISGTEFMIVKWSKVLENGEIVYFCNWFDDLLKSSNSQLFKEDELKPYDWRKFHKSFCESVSKKELEHTHIASKE